MVQAIRLFFIVLIFPATVFAAKFSHFGVEQGLPQSTIQTLLQDNAGNLWIGTMSGVAKYNGIEFVRYSSRDGLAENRITASMLDSKGNIWFGHWGGGISFYNSIKKSFVSVRPGSVPIQKTITAIIEDKKGNIWIGTEGLGLLSIKTETDSAFYIVGQKEGLLSKNIYSILEDNDGSIWLGTDIGITQYLPEQHRCEKIFNNLLPPHEVKAMLRDDQGRKWIGTRDSGVVVIHTAGGNGQAPVFQRIPTGTLSPVTSLRKDSDGSILVGTSGGGAFRVSSQYFDADGNKSYITHFNEQNGLISNNVLSVLIDREHNLWFGTNLGLTQSFGNELNLYGKKDGLQNEQVLALVLVGKDSMLLGTESGLTLFKTGNGYSQPEFKVLPGISGRVNAIYPDPSGSFWISVSGIGLYQVSPNMSAKKIVSSNGPLPMYIQAITLDHEGNVWMGSIKGGAVKFDPKTSRTETFGISEGFRSTTIQTILCDSKGYVWFGTPGGYVTRYDGSTFKTFSEEDGLSDNFILTFAEDKNKQIWCGTYHGILFHFNEKTQHFEKSNANVDAAIHTLNFDTDNSLWIGSSTGLTRLQNGSTSDSKSLNFGFSGIEINSQAVVTREREFWFGTLNGVLQYNPSGFKRNTSEPITSISGFQIFFRDTTLVDGMRLAYDQNYVTIRFEGVNLTEPSKVRYRYKLSGVDRDFSPAVSETYISYPNLEPGTYTFEVIASNNNGIWNKKAASIHFIVVAPFWKTLGFRIGSVVAIVLLVVLVFRIRIRQVEARERVKTELNKKIANTELSALRAQMNPHFIFNTMNSIQHFVVNNDADSAQKYLSKFAVLIRTILTNSRLAYISLTEEVSYLNLYLELEALRFENAFEYEIKLLGIPDPENTEIPSMLIQPYLENSIVHGLMNKVGKGKLSVTMELEKAMLKCIIEDNGVGRKKAMEVKAAVKPKHQSFGLNITSERLSLLKEMNNAADASPSVAIEDLYTPNGEALGTRVILYIPVTLPETGGHFSEE